MDAFDPQTSDEWVRTTPRGRAPVELARTPAEPTSGLQGEAVGVVARQVRAGTYRPRADDVAELLMAWHFLGTSARAN